MNLLGNSSKRTYSLAIVSVLFFAAIVTATARISFAATSSSGVVIPLYTYPTDGSWAASLQAKKAHPNVPIIAVINPSDGPGGSSDSNYVQGVKDFQAAGIIVIGYVATGYASHGMSDLDTQISLYKTWYSVNGIFFDEMSNNAGNENYYSTLNTYVKSLGMTMTMGNPGTSVPSSYIGILDSLCIFEQGGLPTLSYLSSYSGHPKSNFAYIGLSVSSLDTSLEVSSSNYVQWIYITDAGGGNPYDVLPSYFMNEVAALDQGAPSSTTISTTISSTSTSSISTASTSTTTSSATSTTTSTTTSTPAIPTAKIKVKSVDLNGNQLSGMWTTVNSNGITLAAGFTPITFTGAVGLDYLVTVANWQSIIFVHWDDGTTNPNRTNSLIQDTTLTAYYNAPGHPITATVQSVSMTGTPFGGMLMQVHSNGSLVATGLTPLSFNATYGITYTLSAANWRYYVFDHWDDGTTNATEPLTVNGPTTLTAYYRTPVKVTIQSVNPFGQAFSGMWTEVWFGGALYRSGGTTLTFTATWGLPYTVYVANYQNYIFLHWGRGNGNTNPYRTVTPTEDTVIVAVYSTS